MIVEQLVGLLRRPTTAQPHVYDSLNDFGAGVGQYGHALRAVDMHIRWRGWDGAGNVAQWSRGFVQWFDLTLPTLSLPRADWVMCMEVAEHIPSEHEAAVVRNLHAHNCRGIILSWASLGQNGHNHVNNHDASYVMTLFGQLGYWHDAATSLRFQSERVHTDSVRSLPLAVLPWAQRVRIFRRWQPVC